MCKSLWQKLLAVFLFVFLLSVGAFTFFSIQASRKAMTEEFEIRGRELVKAISSQARSFYRNGDLEGFTTLLQSLGQAESLLSIVAYEASRKVWVESSAVELTEQEIVLTDHGPVWELTTTLENGRHVYEFGRAIVAEEEEIVPTKPHLGWLRIMMDRTSLQDRLSGLLIRTLAVSGAFILLGAFLCLILLRRSLRIIQPLLAATQKIAAGDLQTTVPVTSEDELGQLATSFNAMTTSLRQLQEELVQKEKLAAVGQLASGVGHELRNPLGVIKNAVYYLKMKLPQDDEKLAKHIKIMEREVDNSTKIISDLLGFSRTRKPAIAPNDINRVVEDALSGVEVPANIRIAKEFGHGLPSAMVDPDQMRQVFLNLALNAVQAMNEGGMLNITTRQVNGGIEIQFKDSGCGIPQESLNRLFDPFFTTKSRGIGLGLAVSHGIVERHNGKIEVQSAVGRGSTFTVTVPAVG